MISPQIQNLLTGSGILVLLIISLAQSMWTARSGDWLRWVQSACLGAQNAARAYATREKCGVSLIDQQLRKLIQTKRKRLMEKSCTYVRYIMICVFGTMLGSIAMRTPRVFTLMLDCGMLALFAPVLTLQCYPKLLDERRTQYWYSALMATMVFIAVPVTSPANVLHDIGLMLNLFRMLLGIGCMDMKAVALWNIMYSAAASWNYYQGAQRKILCGALLQLIYGEVLSCATTVFTVGVMEQIMTLELRTDLVARLQRDKNSATFALLANVCDAIVELDEEQRICDDSFKLSAVLLHGPDRSLRGTELAQFLPDMDKLIFREQTCLKSPLQVGEHQTNVFCIRMRDSLGGTVNMECFSVHSQGLDGKVHHLIGMRENSETDAMSLRTAGHAPTDREFVSEAACKRIQVAAEIDTATEGLCIRQCTLEFARLFQPPDSDAEAGMRWHVKNSADFVKWLEFQMNIHFHMQDLRKACPLVTTPFHARLRLSNDQCDANFSATCSLDLDKVVLRPDDLHAWIVFSGIKAEFGSESSVRSSEVL